MARRPTPSGSGSARAPGGRIRAEAYAYGKPGLRVSGGQVTEEFLPKLRGYVGRRLYREIADNDAVAGAMLFAFTMLLRNAPWQIAPASQGDGEADQQAEEEAEWIRSMLFVEMRSTWAEVVSEICSMFTYGFAVHEIIWGKRDGKIVVLDLPGRSQESIHEWRFDRETEEVLAAVQRPDTGGEYVIPMEKVALFRTTAERGNPEGRSLLRNSVKLYARKEAIEEAEGRAAIRASGIVKLTLPFDYLDESAGGEEKEVYDRFVAIATSVADDRAGSIILPSEKYEDGTPKFDLTYMVADNRRPVDMGMIVERYDKRMAMSVLAQFLFLGQSSVGSFALSSDQTELFSVAVKAMLETICDTVNRGVIRRVYAVNGMDEASMPSLTFGDLESPNFEALGAFITAITGAGAALFPNTDLENELLELMGLESRVPETSDTDAARLEREAARLLEDRLPGMGALTVPPGPAAAPGEDDDDDGDGEGEGDDG